MADHNESVALERSRHYTWSSPRDVLAGIVAHENPLVWLREMRDGTIPPPPAAATFGFRMDEIEDGRIVFSALAQEWMSNPAGVVHGGMTSALLDTVLTLAVTTRLPVGKMCTTTDLHVHLVRSIVPDGERFRAEGLAVHVGRTLGTAEGRVYDARDRLVAHGTGSFAILDLPSL